MFYSAILWVFFVPSQPACLLIFLPPHSLPKNHYPRSHSVLPLSHLVHPNLWEHKGESKCINVFVLEAISPLLLASALDRKTQKFWLEKIYKHRRCWLSAVELVLASTAVLQFQGTLKTRSWRLEVQKNIREQTRRTPRFQSSFGDCYCVSTSPLPFIQLGAKCL